MRAQRGYPDGRVLGRRRGGSVGQTRRLRRPHLWPADHRRRVLHAGAGTGRWLGVILIRSSPGRPCLLQGRQPVHLPPLRHAAVDQPLARHDHGPMGHSLRSHQHLVGARSRVARLRRPLPIPPPAGPLRRRRRLFLRRKRPVRDARSSPPCRQATTTTPSTRTSCCIALR